MATDYARLRAMKTNDDIDCSDIPPLTEEELKQGEGLWVTPETEYVPLALNRKTVERFRNTGKGYVMRLSDLVNKLLLDYVNKQQLEGVI